MPLMQPDTREFSYPLSSHLRLWPATLLFALFPLWLIWRGAERHSSEIVVAGLTLGAFAILPLSGLVRTLLSPAWIMTTPDRIIVRNYLYRRRAYLWTEIVEVRELSGPTNLLNTNVR